MFNDMPKAELHLHLDGALPPHVILELAERNNLLHLLPSRDIASWYRFRDFRHFVDVVRTIKRLICSSADFELAVYSAAQALSAQNIRYAEVTVTPYTFIDYLPQELTIEDVLTGLEAGRQKALADFDIELRWIFDIPRNRAFEDYHNGGDFVPHAAERTLEYALMGMDYGVIGLGLAGNEVNAPPEPFADIFAKAKAHGLKSLPHAGEGDGASSVRGAVTALQADRIGHGVRAVEDQRLIDELAARQIPLEISMTCNVHLGFYPHIEAHPLPLLDQAGVFITINTDDPMLVNTNLSQEYQLLMDVFGYSFADVARIARNAFAASYAEPQLKSRLLHEFDNWVLKRSR